MLRCNNEGDNVLFTFTMVEPFFEWAQLKRAVNLTALVDTKHSQTWIAISSAGDTHFLYDVTNSIMGPRAEQKRDRLQSSAPAKRKLNNGITWWWSDKVLDVQTEEFRVPTSMKAGILNAPTDTHGYLTLVGVKIKVAGRFCETC